MNIQGYLAPKIQSQVRNKIPPQLLFLMHTVLPLSCRRLLQLSPSIL